APAVTGAAEPLRLGGGPGGGLAGDQPRRLAVEQHLDRPADRRRRGPELLGAEEACGPRDLLVNGTRLADLMAVMLWVWARGALASLALRPGAGNRPGSARAAWMTAAAVQFLLAAERATGFRFVVTNALRGLFADLKRAGTHRTFQQAVIAAFLTV